MADVKLTEKALSTPKSGMNFVVTQPEAIGGGYTLESVRRIPASAVFGYVTPEDFGAVGNGVADDAPALQDALESGYPVRLTKDLYIKSNITVTDKDVWLDGGGYALHVIGTNMTGYMAKGRCIYIYASIHQGIEEDADVVLRTETAKSNPAFGYRSAYHRGYISYHGLNPTPTREEYEEENVRCWYEMRFTLLNTNVVAHDCGGMTVIAAFQTCKSMVDNCRFLVAEGDANVGLRMVNSYGLIINNCIFDGFVALRSRHIENTGYGLQFGGDACTVSNIIARNCKHGVVVGGDAQYFSTGITMNNLTLQAKFDDERASDGARVYQQTLDLHEGIHRPILNNIHCEFDNPTDPERAGTLVMFSCPEVVVNNLQCQHPNRGWQRGYIGFGPEAKRATFSNLLAPMCRIYGYGWHHERGNEYDSNFMQEIYINGGEIGDIRSSDANIHIRLTDVRVNGVISPTRYLWAENCIFKMTEYTSNGKIPIEITGEGWFTHCDIWGIQSDNYLRSLPVIKAPQNTIHMTNCVIRKKLERDVFKTSQEHIVNCEVYDIFGLVLGSSVFGNSDVNAEHYYVVGDQCELDKYNLW